jgi:hypothetical protein
MLSAWVGSCVFLPSATVIRGRGPPPRSQTCPRERHDGNLHAPTQTAVPVAETYTGAVGFAKALGSRANSHVSQPKFDKHNLGLTNVIRG